MPDVPISTAVNRLWLPRLSLGACVRGVMGRDTRHVALGEAQRFNHFPATPLCSLSWWFSGRSEMLLDPQAAATSPRRALPSSTLFGGPHSRPSASWNPGPVHGMMLMLMPDALQQLTGLNPADWLDRLVDVADVLPAPWLAMCESVHSAGDDDARVQLIEEFLEPLWQAARPAGMLSGQRYRDWAQGLAVRAATSGPGRSLRQMERRIKQWTGQPMRELRSMARAESTFFEAARTVDDPRWAELAASGGYADQSHLCRETRRVTGFSPTDLHRRILEDEGFWAYRLWG